MPRRDTITGKPIKLTIYIILNKKSINNVYCNMIMILLCRNLWHNKTVVQATSVAREMTRARMMVCLSNSKRERVGG